MLDTLPVIQGNRFVDPKIEANYHQAKLGEYIKKARFSGQFLLAFGIFSLIFVNLFQTYSHLFDRGHYWVSMTSSVLHIFSGFIAIYFSKQPNLTPKKIFDFFFLLEILYSFSLALSLVISLFDLHALFIFYINLSLFAFYFFFPTTFIKKTIAAVGISLLYLGINYLLFPLLWIYPLAEWVFLALLNFSCARSVLQLEHSERQEFYIKQRLETEIEEHIHTRFELERLVIQDPLTQVCNRRHFQHKYQEALYNAERYGQGFSLIMLDLDHFKRINDRYGHQAGDETLKWFSKQASTGLRDSDVFARYGGEEFVLLLPGTDIQGALTVAQRIQNNLLQTPMIYKTKNLEVTTSIGATTHYLGVTADQMLALADDALYQSKAKGRNQINCLLAPKSVSEA